MYRLNRYGLNFIYFLKKAKRVMIIVESSNRVPVVLVIGNATTIIIVVPTL